MTNREQSGEVEQGLNDELEHLKKLFLQMGAREDQAIRMANQLIKRATQLAEERSISRIEAMEHLLKITINGAQGIGPEED